MLGSNSANSFAIPHSFFFFALNQTRDLLSVIRRGSELVAAYSLGGQMLEASLSNIEQRREQSHAIMRH